MIQENFCIGCIKINTCKLATPTVECKAKQLSREQWPNKIWVATYGREAKVIYTIYLLLHILDVKKD